MFDESFEHGAETVAIIVLSAVIVVGLLLGAGLLLWLAPETTGMLP